MSNLSKATQVLETAYRDIMSKHISQSCTLYLSMGLEPSQVRVLTTPSDKDYISAMAETQVLVSLLPDIAKEDTDYSVSQLLG